MSQSPQRHLFVVGNFRSGTSLLFSFLNLHPRIKLLYEADLLSNYLTTVSALAGLDWWERLDFYNSSISRHQLKPDASWKKARTALQAADLLYRQFAGDAPLYIGEKSPAYYYRLPALAREFPDARFIIIWRDPQAVISSIRAAGLKDHFFHSRSLPLRSLLGIECMQADTLALRAQGTPIFDLCCEDLIENPELKLKEICHFLELPFDPQMLDLEKADTSMYPPGEHHNKAKSGRLNHDRRLPLETPISTKTERYLRRWQIRFQEKLATRRYWRNFDLKPPTDLEIWIDSLDSIIKRFYCEQFIPAVYGLLPISWLTAYRQFRGWSPETAARDASQLSSTKISVITPSYKQLSWLKLCCASIDDQQGVEVEHIIQDAQSGPELEAWVREHSKARLFVEADSGMYDAINRGFARATGDIVCWLNSDEQYLEGTLAKVARFFKDHPEVDVLFGDALLIRNDGKLLSYRRTILPNMRHIQLSHLNILSCATFVRRSVVEKGYTLDTGWKTIADAVWIVSLLKAAIPMAVLNEPLAVFTITDKNLGQTSLAKNEIARWKKKIPYRLRVLRPGYVLMHRLRKIAHGAYWPRSIATQFYTLTSSDQRVTPEGSNIGFRWPEKL